MLAGYMRTNGLEGLGCGLDTSCGCEKGLSGLGGIMDPSSWGPSDWLVVGTLAAVAWGAYKRAKHRRYTRRVVRRLGGY